jgi:hypothetical protein
MPYENSIIPLKIRKYFEFADQIQFFNFFFYKKRKAFFKVFSGLALASF